MRLAADRLDLPTETQAGLAPRRRARRDRAGLAEAARRRATGSSGARSPACVAHPELQPLPRRARRRSTSTPSCTGARARTSSAATSPDEELVALLGRARRARAEARSIDEATASSSCSACASGVSQRELARAELERCRELQQRSSRESGTRIRELA